MLYSPWFLVSDDNFFLVTTQDESPVGLDQSDDNDDNLSDYFADAETSSCGSSDDDTGWPEISENKGEFVGPKGPLPLSSIFAAPSPKYMTVCPTSHSNHSSLFQRVIVSLPYHAVKSNSLVYLSPPSWSSLLATIGCV